MKDVKGKDELPQRGLPRYWYIPLLFVGGIAFVLAARQLLRMARSPDHTDASVGTLANTLGTFFTCAAFLCAGLSRTSRIAQYGAYVFFVLAILSVLYSIARVWAGMF
jgi:hypothetical protein